MAYCLHGSLSWLVVAALGTNLKRIATRCVKGCEERAMNKSMTSWNLQIRSLHRHDSNTCMIYLSLARFQIMQSQSISQLTSPCVVQYPIKWSLGVCPLIAMFGCTLSCKWQPIMMEQAADNSNSGRKFYDQEVGLPVFQFLMNLKCGVYQYMDGWNLSSVDSHWNL